ncbi:response regulator transcription factor [Malaciobacter mytili]|uniref:response regulator transcription factor n=1 Tax=Malaciobacter mytili TaxID=603050 RepID=UPI003A8363AC
MENNTNNSFKDKLKELTILYVEDDSVIRENLISYFKHIFKKTIVAIDGQDGLAKFKTNHKKIDVVITDINMPYLNGIDMIKQIKNINPKIACIITTAYSDKQYLLDSVDFGVNHYILKPFKLDILLKEVEKSYMSKFYIQELTKKNRQIEQLSKLFGSSKEQMKELKNEDKEYNAKLTLFSEIIQLLDRR